MSLVLKISFNDDIRRVSLEKTVTFDQLTTIVRNLFKFGAAELLVKYEDDEKDLVTVTSDLELKEAIALSTHTGHVLRLFVSEKAQAPTVDKGKTHEEHAKPPQAAVPEDFVQFLNPETLLANLTISPDKLGDVLGLLQSFGCVQQGDKQSPIEILKFAKNLVGSVPWLQELLDNVLKREEANPTPTSQPAESASNSSNNNNNNNNAANVHYGVSCDGCQQVPIVGARFKCAVCLNYDLCEKCEAKGAHDPAHPLVKIAQPRSFQHGRRWGGRRGCHEGPVHHGITCDGCQQSPIAGQRFKCTVCPDYDLCEKCNAKGGVHDASHPLESVNVRSWRHPRVPNDGRRCPFKRDEQNSDVKLFAAFVQSVQIPDGTKVAPKAEFTKVWRVRNNGPTAWPESTVLSFVYGDRLESPAAVQLSSVVAPGQELDVAVTMVAPGAAGRFSNYWRLCGPEGTFFGPPLYTRVIVEDSIIEQPVPVDPVVPLVPNVVPVPEPAPVAVPAPVVVPVPEPAPVVAPAPVVIPEPVVPAPAPAPAPVILAPVEETAESRAVGSLRAMGFTGDLLTALRRNGGDLEATVNYLIG